MAHIPLCTLFRAGPLFAVQRAICSPAAALLQPDQDVPVWLRYIRGDRRGHESASHRRRRAEARRSDAGRLTGDPESIARLLLPPNGSQSVSIGNGEPR